MRRPVLPRRLASLAVGLSLLAAWLLASALAAPVASAAPGVVVDLLTVPSSTQPGTSVSASARVRATSAAVPVEAVTIAVRSASGAQADFPGATAATIPTTGTTFTSGTRTFSAGTYDAFVAVRIAGAWYNLDPHRSFTVGGPSSGVVVDSLTLPSPTAGQNVSAAAKVRATSGTVAVQAVTIAGRDRSGTAVDFPGARSASVTTSGYTFTSGTRAFAAGSYDLYVAVQVGGRWYDLDPHRILVVGAAPNPTTFSQTFDGYAGQGPNAGLSAPVWFTDTCWKRDNCGNGTTVQYLDSRAKQDGSNLVFTADDRPDPAAGTCGGLTCTHAGARLTMRDWSKNGAPTFQQIGGHWEARIAMPTGTGLWPAFWTVGDPSTGEEWPAFGEIDIAEHFGDEQNVMHHFLHYGATESDDVNWDATTPPTVDVTAFHVYALDWDPSDTGHLTWSIDGTPTRTVTAAQAEARRPGLWKRIQTHPQSVMLDLAVGGAGGPAPATGWPRTMKIDYVKILRDAAM